MSTPTTYTIADTPMSRGKSNGLLQRLFDRLLAAREAQAHRYLVDCLSNMSDARLAALGYTDEQIRQIRIERRLPELAAA